jgi:hypothetical protein
VFGNEQLEKFLGFVGFFLNIILTVQLYNVVLQLE